MQQRAALLQPWLPWLLLAPQLVIVSLFFIWPAAQALYQSVLLEDAFGVSREFVGLDNFKALWSDQTYWESFKTTIFFSSLVAAIGLSSSLILALCTQRVIRGAAWYKTFLIAPYAVAPVVAAVMWMFLFNSSFGVLTYALQLLGIDWNYALNSTHAMSLIVCAAVWKQISYNFLFFLAGLQSIPRSLMEAASIDGASPWRRFWVMTFPLLAPTTFFLLVINIAYAFFDTFAVIDASTHGGPGKETAILIYRVYHDGFKAQDLGGSAAQSVILMALVALLTILQFRYIERRVNYQ